MHSMQKVVMLLSSAHGTCLGHRLADAVRDERWGEIPDLISRVTPTSPFADKQVAALVSKLEGLDVGIDVETAARDSFFAAEKQCELTNARLARYVNWFENGFFGSMPDLKLFEKLDRMRKRVAEILGPVRDLVPQFSNGSTFHDRGDEITLPHKMSGTIGVTPKFVELGLLQLLRQTAWWPAATGVEVVAGNRFSSVPKSYKTNRGICIEPLGNLSLQLAVGTQIRRRLYHVGIQIDGRGMNNAQWIHVQLARWGSLHDDLATIDLSNASDTISLMLVRLLLPKEWFVLMSALRSEETLVNKRWWKQHKFSSMGNGFTFELETLLFFVIAEEAAGWAKAYGDDLIVPSRRGSSLVEDLEFFGFTVNKEKSYLSGLFRESCGGDFLGGRDTRPVYLKKVPSNPLMWIDLYNLLDGMEAKSRANATLLADSPLLKEARRFIVSQVPALFRLYVPKGCAGGFWSDQPEAWIRRSARLLRKKRSFFWGTGIAEWDRGYDEFKTVMPQSVVWKLNRFSADAQLASALLGTPSRGVTPRDGTCGVKIAWRAL